ncbi:uncharacterized protein METZ01_LOCUS336624 [marine metagenome]|uniref:Uncharacterized protein n=1 Tax=marine metagenome TaxID=408172 RepID=A0A382QFM7_9ZZZZ
MARIRLISHVDCPIYDHEDDFLLFGTKRCTVVFVGFGWEYRGQTYSIN